MKPQGFFPLKFANILVVERFDFLLFQLVPCFSVAHVILAEQSGDFGATKLRSTAYITGPNRYRKVEDKWKKPSVKSPGRNSATLKSNDQQLNTLTAKTATAISM